MEVPWRELSPGALRGVIEAHVLEEGTDYGGEYTLEEKVAQVLAQLKRGEAVIVFDPQTETTGVVPHR